MEPQTLEEMEAELEDLGRIEAALMLAVAVKGSFAPGYIPVSFNWKYME